MTPRLAVTLPPEARDVPADAFTLRAKRVGVQRPSDAAAWAADLFWRQLTDWQLVRDPHDRAAGTLVVPPIGMAVADWNLQLRA